MLLPIYGVNVGSLQPICAYIELSRQRSELGGTLLTHDNGVDP